MPAVKKNSEEYPYENLSLNSMKGEEWADIPGFDGAYSISNFGRIWAAPRLIISADGKQLYFTKERIRKQSLARYYNSYTKDYMYQLSVHLRYEGGDYSFKVNRLVYHAFVKPIDFKKDKLVVVHKDSDNLNNRYDNLVLMNGTELYIHGLHNERRPRSGQVTIKNRKLSWSDKNSPRPVVKYSLDGKKIEEYASVAEAAQKNNSHRSSVRAIVQQKLKQLNGYVYRYKGTPYKGEYRNFSYEKKVTQYSLDGKKIKVYPSVKEAGSATGNDPDTISKCALHKMMTCGGYVWRYEGDLYRGEYKDKIKNKPQSLVQYSLAGKKIAQFDSVGEASRKTGFNASTLLDCAHKRTKTSHDFVWRFAGDTYKGEYSEHRIGKPVTQYTKEGKKLGVYPTIEAAARSTGLTSANIQKNVSGSNKTAGGYIWKFSSAREIRKHESSFEKNIRKALQTGKEVVQYTLDGKKLAVYKSISEAAKACELQPSNISSAVDKPKLSAGGYVWRTKGNIYRGALAKTPRTNQGKSVTQYDLKGNKVQTYESTRQAQQKIGVPSGAISAVARGKLKSSGGYIWLYNSNVKRINVQKHYASTYESIQRNSKRVVKYSLEGELLKTYASVSEAGREEGISAKRISSVINGHSKSAGGFLWKSLKD
jgi:hypothetical protein